MAKNTKEPIEVKVAEVKKLGTLQCTDREAAAFLGIRYNTFKNLLRDDPKVREAWDRGKYLGLISLRRKQFRLASKSSTMAIFLGKQYLGQRDLQSHAFEGADGEPLDLSGLSKDEREKLREFITRGDNEDSDTE